MRAWMKCRRAGIESLNHGVLLAKDLIIDRISGRGGKRRKRTMVRHASGARRASQGVAKRPNQSLVLSQELLERQRR
jgi:hypothetical protein